MPKSRPNDIISTHIKLSGKFNESEIDMSINEYLAIVLDLYF